eukprot:TRINITY_DN1576_c0_g1_i2.p1 TRINITY_DN1576_c0_g1~~TRINITY_DN1576_c0_g1_i2.p1  ORF type:complete len:483 (+),score=1.91 TRINITY_DN1576_c0_g1_i2:43-1449(+)
MNMYSEAVRPIVCVSPPLVSLLVLSWILNLILIYQIFRGQHSQSNKISQFFISQNEDYKLEKIQNYDNVVEKQDDENRLFLYSYELGVQHFEFFGKVLEYNETPIGLRHSQEYYNLSTTTTTTDQNNNDFLVHLFLKSRIVDNKLKLKGFVMGEEYPESYRYRTGILEIPKILQNVWGDIWILNVNKREMQYQIRDINQYNYQGKCKTCPLCVTAELPEDFMNEVFELHMSTFKRYHYFSHSMAQKSQKYQLPRLSRPQLIFVLAGPFYEKFYKGVEPKYIARVLAHHIHYHITYMAVDKYVIYCREHFIKIFLEDKDIKRQVLHGVVTVVLWQEIPNHYNKRYALQPTMISHAVLVHWGSNVRLLLGDVDEFVATPIPQTNLHTLIYMCNVKQLSYIYREEYQCEKCIQNPQLQERQLWQGDVFQRQPLVYYNSKKLFEDKNNPKGFVDPNKVCTWSYVRQPVVNSK